MCRGPLSTSYRTQGLTSGLSPSAPRALSPLRLGPDLHQLDYRRSGDRQILHRHPLADGVVLHAAVVDVRRRQAHLRQARAVGAAANRVRARLEPDAAGGLGVAPALTRKPAALFSPVRA